MFFNAWDSDNNCIHNPFSTIALLSKHQVFALVGMWGPHTTFMASIRHAASQVWLFNLLVLWRPLLACGCLLFKFSFSTICSSSGNSTWSSDLSLYFRSNLRFEFFFKNTYYSQLWFALVLSQLHLVLVFLSCGLALVWSQLQFGTVFVWVVHFIVLSQL